MTVDAAMTYSYSDPNSIRSTNSTEHRVAIVTAFVLRAMRCDSEVKLRLTESRSLAVKADFDPTIATY
jgi:hypothetical protein